MSRSRGREVWAAGEPYESYVGRWSHVVAREFVRWLEAPPGLDWLDVGCGTGALTRAIAEQAGCRRVTGVDPSEGFIAYAREHIRYDGVDFRSGDARQLPFDDASFDAAVSGLVLNFVPEPRQAVSEKARVTRPGGVVGAYVWDYGDKMEVMRHFWDAAAALDAEAKELDEGRRFPLCRPEALKELFEGTGLGQVETRPIDIETHFRDFADYWSPFLGGQGAAPHYLTSLSEEERTALRERLRAELPVEQDGSIRLIARAWAARGQAKG